ncbi:MAG: DPP IV N-terminal domain-containing protein [Chitinophagaceae bacterium]
MFTTKQKAFCTFVLSLCSLSLLSQKKDFTNDQLLKNQLPAITTTLPQLVKWETDRVLVLRKEIHPDSAFATFVLDPQKGKEQLWVTENVITKPALENRVFTKSNDLYLLGGSMAEVRLTNDKEKEVNPVVSPDWNYVAFTKSNNLYVIDLNTRKETQVTKDGSDVILNGYASWVYMEEILGRATAYKAFWWSPDSKHLAFFRSDDSQVPQFTITDANGDHGVVELTRYPKVGDKNPEIKVGIFEVNTRKTVWADFDPKEDQYFGMPYWRPDGSSLLLQWMDRKQENLKIYDINLDNGNKKEFYAEHQRSWVEFDKKGKRLTFLKNGKNFLYTSDKSGFNHIYHYGPDSKLLGQVTSGKFAVTSINLVDEKKGLVYFTARGKENTAREDFYSIRLNGKDLKRLTFGDFTHSVQLSPGGNYFITTYGNATTPNRMALLSIKGKLIKELGDAKGPEFDNYNFAKSELIRVKSDDGLYDLPSYITWPLNMDPNKKYPVLVSIYGGPDRQDAFDKWTLTANQQWYAKEGLIQIAIDHRGSLHFGKEGSSNMHRNLGYWEMKDYSSVINYLINKGFADSTKIGIVGFSYGGYLSAYALTYGADVFTHGMAGGTVTDWRLYDTHYAERLMDTPAENPQGYKSASVLTHANKYKGMLQIVHGMIDDNVHMQNSIQLVSLLQEQKKDFEFMLYSGGRHGWKGNKWAHFQNLKTKFIYKYLLEQPVPKEALK